MSDIKRIYMDYNATAPISKPVRDFFVQELDFFANGSSLHEDGRTVGKQLEKARSQVAALINAEPSEIIFTSGGSESNNTVFNSMISYSEKNGRNSQMRILVG